MDLLEYKSWGRTSWINYQELLKEICSSTCSEYLDFAASYYVFFPGIVISVANNSYVSPKTLRKLVEEYNVHYMIDFIWNNPNTPNDVKLYLYYD